MREVALTRSWRVLYAVLGAVLLLPGALGTVGLIVLARRGVPQAWPVASCTAFFAFIGGYLVKRAITRG